jgi:hypothetical protein
MLAKGSIKQESAMSKKLSRDQLQKKKQQERKKAAVLAAGKKQDLFDQEPDRLLFFDPLDDLDGGRNAPSQKQFEKRCDEHANFCTYRYFFGDGEGRSAAELEMLLKDTEFVVRFDLIRYYLYGLDRPDGGPGRDIPRSCGDEYHRDSEAGEGILGDDAKPLPGCAGGCGWNASAASSR